MFSFLLSMLRDTAIVPAIVSIVVAGLIWQLPIRRIHGGVAVAAGFFGGWASQPWGTLEPERYLHWCPYAAVLLAVAACLFVSSDRQWVRWGVLLIGSGVTAWFLVPDFPKLVPPKALAVALVTGLSFIVAALVEAVEHRLPRRASHVAFLMIGGACAMILAQSFALKFSQIAGMLTAALTGPLLFATDEQKRRTAVVFLPLLGSVMFMGYASSTSEVPTFCYVVPLFAVVPLLMQVRPASQGVQFNSLDIQPHPSFARTAVSWALVLAILLVASIPALLAHPPWEMEANA